MFNSYDMACWFDSEQQFKDRFIMRDLLQQINDRLNEINDESYTIEPIALDFYNELCKKNALTIDYLTSTIIKSMVIFFNFLFLSRPSW